MNKHLKLKKKHLNLTKIIISHLHPYKACGKHDLRMRVVEINLKHHQKNQRVPVGHGSLVMGALVELMEPHDACRRLEVMQPHDARGRPESLNTVDHAHSTTNEDRV